MKNAPAARLLSASVADWAAADLRACELFDRVGLSFADDGGLSVQDACRQRHVDEAMVLAELERFGGTPPVGGSPCPLDETCSQLIRRHHGPLRASLESLRTCLSVLEAQAGGAALVEMRQRLEALAVYLLMHFAKEENILFPAFAALAGARQRNDRRPPLPFPTVMHPIRAMEVEHERIDLALHALTGSRDLDRLPDCRPQLSSFTQQLIAHTRFENELLFARALDVERMLG